MKKENKNSNKPNKIYKLTFILLIILLVTALFFFLRPLIQENFNSENKDDVSWNLDFLEKKKNSESEEKKVKFRDKLTGEPREEKSEIFPVTIVIDNHLDARPAFGLDKAKIVYEAPVEGRITRYVAIFDSEQKIEKIGPVRSARPYFIDWNQELSGLFVHCGGSPQALLEIVEENVFNLNEFYRGKYFWREDSLARPHNIFTSLGNIKDYIQEREIDTPNFFSWEFEDREVPETVEDKEILLGFTSGYGVKWVYDEDLEKYVRYLNNKKHITGKGNVITASNIVLQKTKNEIIDKKLRLRMSTVDEGEAIICSQGVCSQGEWKKESDYSRTRYFNQHGFKYKFTPGKTWIEVIDEDVNYEIN